MAKSMATSARKKGRTQRGSKVKAELIALLDELDEPGLQFLLEQARVHRYNMEVEGLNTTSSKLPKKASAPPAVRIERSDDGETYHIVVGGKYKMFTAEEMLALVRIAHANGKDSEAAGALRRWLMKERRDALSEFDSEGPSSFGLIDLARLLKKSFSSPR